MSEEERAHKSAIASALRSVARMDRLFARGGSLRGTLVADYREARKAAKTLVESPAELSATLSELRRNVLRDAADLFREAARIGRDQANADAANYGLPVPVANVIAEDLTSKALDVIAAELDRQRAALLGLSIAGSLDAERMIGDGTRAGLLSATSVLLASGLWIVSIYSGTYANAIGHATRGTEGEFLKQAIAAIDSHTTECCLDVTGQTVALSGMFRLTGTPRFADRMTSPPFHWNCRTATATVRKSAADDSLTKDLIDAADHERRQRAAESKAKAFPVHARSKR